MTNTFEMDNASSPESGRILLLTTLLTHLGIGETATELETTIARSSLVRAEGAVIRALRYDPVMKVRTEFYPNQAQYFQYEGVWEANQSQAYLRTVNTGASDELQVCGLPVREADTNDENQIDLRIDYDGRSGTRSGSFGDATIKVEGTDFHPNYDLIDSGGRKVCRDGIIRSLGLWPQTPGSVKITYVAGYTADELAGTDSVIDASPIQEAVLDEATRRFHLAYSRMKKTNVGFSGGPFSSEKLGDYSYTVANEIQKEFLSLKSDILMETAFKLESFVNMGVELFS